jgi:hypothetical protein
MWRIAVENRLIGRVAVINDRPSNASRYIGRYGSIHGEGDIFGSVARSSKSNVKGSSPVEMKRKRPGSLECLNTPQYLHGIFECEKARY